MAQSCEQSYQEQLVSGVLNKMGLESDPLTELNVIMETMSKSELKKLVLLACNRVGVLTKGGDYENTEDAMIHFLSGVTTILSIYQENILVSKPALSPTPN